MIWKNVTNKFLLSNRFVYKLIDYNLCNCKHVSFFCRKPKPKKMYIIERATLTDYEAVKKFLWCWYYPHEPLFVAADIGRKVNHVIAVRDDQGLSEGYTLLAKHKCDGSIVGVCLNVSTCPWDAHELHKFATGLRCGSTRKVLEFQALMIDKPDVWHQYCCQKIFEIEKLAVNNEFRGKGVGKALIKASRELGADCGFRCIRCIAKNYYTGLICEKLKMKMVMEYPYSNHLNEHGAPMFCPPPPHSMIKVFIDTPHSIRRRWL